MTPAGWGFFGLFIALAMGLAHAANRALEGRQSRTTTMPTRKVSAPKGRRGPCHRYGEQKVYCGKGAEAKADKQGRAIKASQGRRRKG